MEVIGRVGSKTAYSNDPIRRVGCNRATEVVFNVFCCLPRLKELPQYVTFIRHVRIDFAQYTSDRGFGSLESEELLSCVFLAISLAHLKRMQKILKSLSGDDDKSMTMTDVSTNDSDRWWPGWRYSQYKGTLCHNTRAK